MKRASLERLGEGAKHGGTEKLNDDMDKRSPASKERLGMDGAVVWCSLACRPDWWTLDGVGRRRTRVEEEAVGKLCSHPRCSRRLRRRTTAGG
jgi:hypothetical protein